MKFLKFWHGLVCGLALVSSNVEANHYGLFFGRAFRANLDCTSEILFSTGATKVWSGGSYGACTVSACESGFIITSNQCVPTGPETAEVEITTAGSYSFTVPAGVTKILIIGSGGGGGGGSSNLFTAGGAGGGGGAHYSRTFINVNPGEIYSINVAAGGFATNSSPAVAGGPGGTSSVLLGPTPILTWGGGGGGGAGNNGNSVGGGGSGAGNGGNGGSGTTSGGTGQNGSYGSQVIFTATVPGNASGPWFSGGGGGGGGASLGSGGKAAHVGISAATPGVCGGGGGGTGGNDNGGGIPTGREGGDGCVFIYY